MCRYGGATAALAIFLANGREKAFAGGRVMTRRFLMKTLRGQAAACAARSGVRRAVEVPPASSLDFMELVLPVLESAQPKVGCWRAGSLTSHH